MLQVVVSFVPYLTFLTAMLPFSGHVARSEVVLQSVLRPIDFSGKDCSEIKMKHSILSIYDSTTLLYNNEIDCGF